MSWGNKNARVAWEGQRAVAGGKRAGIGEGEGTGGRAAGWSRREQQEVDRRHGGAVSCWPGEGEGSSGAGGSRREQEQEQEQEDEHEGVALPKCSPKA